jgi:2-polyprenyl-3-methyl-5-hydroxy-6-metoxy-1,4-benzoquinol methylase
MIKALKNRLSPAAKQRLRTAQRRVIYLKERIVGGGQAREDLLVRLLAHHYSSMFRRQWELADEEPHFFSHRIGLFEFAYGEVANGPFPYYRGFFNSEVLRPGDQLLDIGCGDGFFTKRFFSERCSHIDAVDIEPTAIQAAQARNAAANITYRLLDAVAEPFPAEKYDVIIWDGALGHFPPETTHTMLRKISASLAPAGIFAGSESLGVEGTDHLQFFHQLDDLRGLFQPYFKHVALREINYNLRTGFRRREGFWRCANDTSRLDDSRWQL